MLLSDTIQISRYVHRWKTLTHLFQFKYCKIAGLKRCHIDPFEMDFKHGAIDLCERSSDGRGSNGFQEDYLYYGCLSSAFRSLIELLLRDPEKYRKTSN